MQKAGNWDVWKGRVIWYLNPSPSLTELATGPFLNNVYFDRHVIWQAGLTRRDVRKQLLISNKKEGTKRYYTRRRAILTQLTSTSAEVLANWQVSERSHPWGAITERRRSWRVVRAAGVATSAGAARHGAVPASRQPCSLRFPRGETWTGKGGGAHLSLERSAGPGPVACLPSQEKLSALCPGAGAKLSLRDARCAQSKGAGSTARRGRSSRGAKVGRRAEKRRELPAPPLAVRAVHPCCACRLPRSGRQTPSKSMRSSACTFLPKTLAPGVQDQLGTRCTEASETKTQSPLSWSPSVLYLGILLPSPFPQGTTSWQGREAVPGLPLPCCAPGFSGKGWHIPESTSAAVTGPSSQSLTSSAGLQSLHHSMLGRGKTGAEWELVPTLAELHFNPSCVASGAGWWRWDMGLKIITFAITALVRGLCCSALAKADVAEEAHHMLLPD